MRTFAKGAGATVRVTGGGIIFAKGEQGDFVQSGTIDMIIGETVMRRSAPMKRSASRR
jgi:hypothetical protein